MISQRDTRVGFTPTSVVDCDRRSLRDPVLEALRVGVAVYDFKRRLITFNAAYAAMFSLDMVWLDSAPEFSVVLAHLSETRMLPEAADLTAYRAQQLSRFTSSIAVSEEILHLPDGRSIHHIVRPHPDGGLILTYEDLTHPLVLEREHNAQEAVGRVTLDALSTAIAAIGGDGCLRLTNMAFRAHWQLEATNLTGRPISELVLEMANVLTPTGNDTLRHIITTLHERRKVCLNLQRIDGRTIAGSALPLPDGAMLLFFDDITDQLTVTTALADRDAAFGEADRAKTAFISNVSFEVRGPLNALTGFAKLLADEAFGSLNTRQREYAVSIRDTALGLSNVLSNILALAAIEAGQTVLSLGPVDVSVLLSNAVGLVRERARAKPLSLQVDCAPNFGSTRADGNRLKQVLLELLDNAIKHTPARGTVTISAKHRDNGTEIAVADTGRGISKVDRDCIFQPFERGSPSNSSHSSSAGLGLTIARRFMELHGGRIELTSRPGRGTTVRCWIPAN